MLHWQYNRAHKIVSFWARILLIVFICHLVFCLIIVIKDYFKNIRTQLSLTEHHAITLVPIFFKQEHETWSALTDTYDSVTTVDTLVHTNDIPAEPVSNIVHDADKNTAPEEICPPTAALIHEHEIPVSLAATPDYITHAPTEKQTVEKKNVSQKIIAKNQSNKIASPTPNPKKNTLNTLSKTTRTGTASKKTVPYHKIEQITLEELGGLPLQEYTALRKKIIQQWQSPLGVGDSLHCTLKISVDKEGKITQIDIQEPSGVLLYDIAARNTLMNVRLPAAMGGRTLIMTFKG